MLKLIAYFVLCLAVCIRSQESNHLTNQNLMQLNFAPILQADKACQKGISSVETFYNMQLYDTQEMVTMGSVYYLCQNINLIVGNFYPPNPPCNPLVEKCLLKEDNSSSEENVTT